MRVTALHTTPGELTLPSPAVGGLGPIHKIGLVATRIETDAGLFGEHLLITLHGRHVRVLEEVVQRPCQLGGLGLSVAAWVAW